MEPQNSDAVDPVAALREIAFWMERDRAQTHRVKAYRRAADTVAALSDGRYEQFSASGRWQDIPGIGPKTAAVIAQASAGKVPDKLTELRSAAKPDRKSVV